MPSEMCMVCSQDIPHDRCVCEKCACDMGRLRAGKQAVFDAVMAWMYCDPEYSDIALSNLRVACRRAKEEA